MNFILFHAVYNDLQLSNVKCKPLNKKHKLNMKLMYPPYFKVFCEEKYKCIINNNVNVEGIKTRTINNKTEFESSGTRIFKIVP